jgi:hypothetical protein
MTKDAKKTEQSSDNTTPDKKGRGRPREESIKLTREARRYLDTQAAQDAPKLYAALLTAALGGCTASISLMLTRIWPVRKGQTLNLEEAQPPSISTPADVGVALEWVYQQVCGGRITPDEGHAIAGIINQRASAFEFAELAAELLAMKERLDAMSSAPVVKIAA